MFQRLLLAIPIVLLPNSLHVPFDTGIPAINPANLLLIMLVLVLAMSPRPANLPPAGPGLLTAPILLLFLSISIGLVIAVATRPDDFATDLTNLKDFMFYPLLYFVYRHCHLDLRGTRMLIVLTILIAVAAGLESVWDGLAQDSFTTYNEANRIAGPFGGFRMSNRAGVFYAMFLPLLVAFVLFIRGHRLLRLMALAGIVVLAAAIIVTYSRQSYLIAVVTTLILLSRRHVLLVVLLALAAIPAITLLPEGVTQRVAHTQQVSEIGETQLDDSTASRFEIWEGAMRMWRDHPAGVGLGRFPSYIGDYSDHDQRDAHNMYVLLLAECGPLGLVAMLWLLWRMLRLSITVQRSSGDGDSESKALAIGFALSMVAMAMGNLYGSAFNNGLVMANFWILCGLVEHYAALKRNSRTVDTVGSIAVWEGIHQRFPLAASIAPGLYRQQTK